MINKCWFLLQYFKNSVNNLPPSSLSQPESRGLKLDSWLRRAAGRVEYINLVCNEEHGYICAMMNLGARGGCILSVFHIDPSVQPFLNGWIWSQEISGKRSCWGLKWASLFFAFFSFFPGWKRWSSFLDSNLFASKMGCACPFPPSPFAKKCVAKPHWKIHFALESLSLQPFTLKDTSYGPF